MLITLAIGSASGLAGCIITILSDDIPQIPRWIITAVVCAASFLFHQEEPIFRCGIVISPTTDWLRYEASIAERYLGDAVDQQYYVLSKTDKHIQMIKNDTILLMDSFPYNPVQHFQSVKFNSQLTNAGIRFDYKTYPQAGIKKMIEYHSYLSLEHFITQCLKNGN
ncbi:inactive dipeptidyl peptidase 10-like [Daphnia magna]|nr:inactive dipeptidyl peptidase 10-like [Daphnia magna]